MEGECKVATINANIGYIQKKAGINGVDRVIEELKKRGYPQDIRKMKDMDLVPVDMRKELLFVVRDELGWDDKRIMDMGEQAVKSSFIMRTFIGIFMNMERIFKTAPDMWKNNYTVGKLGSSVDSKKGEGVITLTEFDQDPLVCTYFLGYFIGVAKLAKTTNLHVKETKCIFRGDDCHEYIFTWTP